MNKALSIATMMAAGERVNELRKVHRTWWPIGYTRTIREPLTWREQREQQTGEQTRAALARAEAKRERRRERNRRNAARA